MGAVTQTAPRTIPRSELSDRRRDMVDSIRWGWFNAIGYVPHYFQIKMHESQARYRTSCAGRRGGKSEWAAREASAYMIAGPFRVWIVAPSYELGWREFRVVVDSLMHEANPYTITSLTMNRKAGNLHIALSNGSECDVISIDKPRKSGHGEEVDLIILSEAGLADNLGGEDGVWNKTLVGAMATRRADVIVPTTPQGEDDFLYPMFMKGLVPDSEDSKYEIFKDEYIDLRAYYKCREEHDPDYFSLQWPSWANKDGYTEDVQKQYQNLPWRIFMEQVAGFFVKWSGSIWLNDFCYDPEIHFIEPIRIPNWWYTYEVIDPGFSGLFAWIKVAVDEQGHIFVIDEYYTKRTVFDEHYKEIVRRRHEIAQRNGYEHNTNDYIPIYVDPEDPQTRAELNKLGLKCTQANNDVTAGFQAGGSRFKNGEAYIFNTCSMLDRSLRNHEWAKQRSDGAKIKEANDSWKHFSDVWRYANLASIWASEQPATVSDRETIDDIFNSMRGSSKSPLDWSDEEWEKEHAA